MFSSFSRSFIMGKRPFRLGYDASVAGMSLNSSPSDQVSEGGVITFTLSTTNISNGTRIPYTVTGGAGFDASADISSGITSGTFLINNNTASISLTVSEDFTGEGNESMTLTIIHNPSVTRTVTISDTSVWTPSQNSSLVAWIDAADTSSYTLSSNKITSVTDKAGTYSMSSVGSPTAVQNAVNGLNIFAFDGSNQYLQSSSYEVQASNGNHWAIGVFAYDATDATKDSFWSYETNQNPKRDYAISSGANNNSWPGEIDLDGLSSNRISSTIGNLEQWNLVSLTRLQFYIVVCWFDKTGNQIGVRVNGSNAFSPVNDYDNSIQSNQELRLMRNRSSEELRGYFGEFFAVADRPGLRSGDLSFIEEAEGYLAHKWDLAGDLPSGHPYKTSAP